MEFSIIVPIYNKEKYLKRCLDSVLHQTFYDFECLLIDDGSTDSSAEICKGYLAKYPHFRYIKKANGGLSDARNFGIERADGKFLLFLDADDTIHPDTLHICHSIFQLGGIDIIAFGIAPVFSGSDVLAINRPISIIRDMKDFDLVDDMLSRSISWSVCNKIYKKEVFLQIRFPVGKLFEDQFVALKLLKNRSIITIENNLYFYYQDVEDSLSKRKIYPEVYDYLLAAIEILKDVEGNRAYSEKAALLAYKRIVLMLTNVFYKEGQFQNCRLQIINRIVSEYSRLILKYLPKKEKWTLKIYLKVPACLKSFLIRMRFEPSKYIIGKLRRIGE